MVNAFRADAEHHEPCPAFLDSTGSSSDAFGLASIVLSGFLRVVIHPSVFKTPSPLGDVLEFTDVLREQPQAELVEPRRRHWDIFTAPAEAVDARGNLIPDAYLAAIAIESGSTWVSTNRDFARFSDLRWINPLTV